MSKRKTPKASPPSPRANGLKLARELMGLILLFFGLYLLLSLVTFDAHDPDFNHAISTANGVHNGAGIIGSYLSGILTDIFGVAAYIWPVFILVLAMRQLFFRFSVQWWRCLGFICLLLCFMMAGTAWKFQVGDIVGGGLIGDVIYGISWKFLSEIGSLLLGLCFFFISLQLMFNISWLVLWRAFGQWLLSMWDDMRGASSESHHEHGDDPNDDPNTGPVAPKEQGGNAQKVNARGLNSKEQRATSLQLQDTAAGADVEIAREEIHLATDSKSSVADTAAKTGIWTRIKQAFSKTNPNDVTPLAQNLEHSAIDAENPNNLCPHDANDVMADTPHQHDVLIAQSGGAQVPVQDFLQDAHGDGPNPFAAPWARACDIQAEWAQEEDSASPEGVSSVVISPITTSPKEQTHLGLEQEELQTSVASSHSSEQIGPNGGLVIEGYAEGGTEKCAEGAQVQALEDAYQQVSTTPEDFVFDSFPENIQDDYDKTPVIQDDYQNFTTEYEIELDATMAIQADDAQFSFDDGYDGDNKDVTAKVHTDVPANADEQTPNQDIAATLRELQHVLDMPTELHTAERIAALSTSNHEQGIATTPLAVRCDADSSASEGPTDELGPTSLAPSAFDSNSPDDMPSSFEVLMDADKDGITDLTEEEVGTGGAAKAAPVKMKTRLPHLDLLQDVTDDEHSKPRLDILTEKGERLTKCLADFGIQGELTRITPGPVVTMFEFRPAPGVKVSRIANLSDDLALALKAIAVRIQAPIPGTDTVGIEIPNEIRETIYFRDLLASQTFHDASSLLTLAVGKDSAGRPSVADLAKMPHLLVAGATGAGKSVCLNSILLSFLYKARPEDVQLLLIDPKRIELAVYADLPHLVHPVVTDMSHAKNALEWAVHEMDKRYEGMARLGVRNIAGYNQKLEGFGSEKPIEYLDLEFMPYLVIIIDELADLMLTAAKEVETSIVRLAQLARAAGIHMVLATQRPSVDVVTGLIKANFPCRISFQVTSKHDSRTILDTVGAEHLLGRGDMLFKPSGGRLQRLHGAFVSDDEVANVVEFWKRQQAPMYRVDFAQWGSDATQDSLEGGAGALADDPIYNDAVEFVLGQGQASISLVQRRFRIGFNKAARYVEQMELDGIVGPANGSKPRPVIKGQDI